MIGVVKEEKVKIVIQAVLQKYSYFVYGFQSPGISYTRVALQILVIRHRQMGEPGDPGQQVQAQRGDGGQRKEDR